MSSLALGSLIKVGQFVLNVGGQRQRGPLARMTFVNGSHLGTRRFTRPHERIGSFGSTFLGCHHRAIAMRPFERKSSVFLRWPLNGLERRLMARVCFVRFLISRLLQTAL